MVNLPKARDTVRPSMTSIAGGSVFAVICIWTFLESGHWAWLVVAMLQVVGTTAGLGEPRPRPDRNGTRIRRAKIGDDSIAEQSRVERVRVKRSTRGMVMSAGAERVPGVAAVGRLGRGRGG